MEAYFGIISIDSEERELPVAIVPESDKDIFRLEQRSGSIQLFHPSSR
jgi:hypothetical protein